ncbi:MAG: hypothetical protein ACU0GG_05650 [Paracoccaceae bacterium]
MSKLVLPLLIFMAARPAFSQAMSQEDIAAAVATMRNSGASEETIQQFLDGMAQANAFQQNMQDLQDEGLSEGEAALRASGMDKDSAAQVGGIAGFLGALGAVSEQNKLKAEIAAFAEAHADKPDVVVIAANTPFQLKLLRCDYSDETYQIKAEGLPTEAGRSGPILQIGRSGPYAGGDSGVGYYLESINFLSPDVEASTDSLDVDFDGGTFAFEGMVQPKYGQPASIPLKIEFQCS